MAARVVRWAWIRYQPDEGWLPIVLLMGAVFASVTAVLSVEWVPEAGIAMPASILGLLMGIGLAKRPLHTGVAWFFIIIYGLLLVFIWLGDLTPPVRVLADGWEETFQYWRQNGALFLDRILSWLDTVLRGGRSRETIAFAFALGFAAWLLSAFVGWTTFRQRRPLMGLTALGVAIAINGFYGKADIWPAAIYVAFTGLLTAVMHFAELEQGWREREVDFSDEIRLDLIINAGAIAIALLFIALITPTIRFSSLSRAILDTGPVRQVEDTLERVFAGVRQPRGRGVAETGTVEGFAAGGMPRSYLIGDPPELYETVVMTATVTTGDQTPVPAVLLGRSHWRAISYDMYTGRGWARSDEREETHAADETIQLPPAQRALPLRQSVDWLFGPGTVRYTMGLPFRFDHAVTTRWRGLEDLVWVRGEETQYQATSRVTVASADELRATDVNDVAPAILARYTRLPATVPVRVHELAEEIAGAMLNPYDQARAIELFLRQYPYSLNVDLPPVGVDPVDFFLFEQQTGYCDYYASAMVVMARSLGLPARVGVGFLSQAPDSFGVQTIYQINGHSWAEVYFAGYGWVEFEPTAAFPSPFDLSATPFDTTGLEFGEEGDPTILMDTPAIPEREPRRPFPWQRVGLAAMAGLILWFWYRRRAEPEALDSVSWAYGQMQKQARKVGYPAPVSETPHEFAAGLLSSLSLFATNPWFAATFDEMRSGIGRLTELFVAHQYSTQKGMGAIAAREIWRRLRLTLWRARLIAFVRRLTGRLDKE